MKMSWRRAVATIFALAVLIAPTAVAGSLPDFTALVEQQGPSVVNISTTAAAKGRGPTLPWLDENDPMFDLFRRFIPRLPESPPFDQDNRSLGSGFIIDPDGYILTNAHVIEDADEIIVRLSDRREFHAEVIGADARSDLAVIRIDAHDLQPVAFGKPDALKVGEWVVAIGSPFGFEHSVTAGIVSAKGRNLPDENFVPFIQTDVAINPGNSGGPLFNLRGEVVGVNSQIYSRTGGFMGLSFAIPIDVAMNVQEQLRTSGQVSRGRIGVAIQEVTRALAESFGLPEAAGALVSSVEPEGPAAKAGVKQGDVIVGFAGQPVQSSGELPRIVAASRPGTTVAMEVLRRGQRLELQVTVGQWTDDAASGARRVPPPAAVPNKLGIVVGVPTAAQRRERGMEQGLIVERVQGAAARSDIRPGDVILAVVANGRQSSPASIAEFHRLAAELREGQYVTLLVHRGSGASYVSFRVGR